MALTPAAFAARFDELCSETEADVLSAFRTLADRITVLAEVGASAPEEDRQAMITSGNARMEEMERRILKGLLE